VEINWIAVGWIIDMILNGLVWFIIAVLSLLLIDMTDTWTRKAIKLMDKADKWIRKLIDNLFEWIRKKNLEIVSGIILLIVFGILAQLGIIPKLIT
jgi:F0F1-type ATP synthase assembly protein I